MYHFQKPDITTILSTQLRNHFLKTNKNEVSVITAYNTVIEIVVCLS